MEKQAMAVGTPREVLMRGVTQAFEIGGLRHYFEVW